jgi:hypothetical protein
MTVRLRTEDRYGQDFGALAYSVVLAGVYCGCAPETLRISTKSFHS